MPTYVHADDYGLSHGVTDSILACIDDGALNSASIVPNGHAFDYAVEQYLRRRNTRQSFRLSVHLNYCEASPVLPAERVPALVDKNGHLDQRFLRLWWRFQRGSVGQRRELYQQVRAEAEAQMLKVWRAVGGDEPLSIDSHRHLHLIPFVQRIVRELADELPIDYVRVPCEPFFVSLTCLENLTVYLGPNLLKHFLLGRLSSTLRHRFRDKPVRLTDHFVGVLYTGQMSATVMRKALSRIPPPNRGEIVEVLYHPGRPNEDERRLWAGRQELMSYYFSPRRGEEAEALRELAGDLRPERFIDLCGK